MNPVSSFVSASACPLAFASFPFVITKVNSLPVARSNTFSLLASRPHDVEICGGSCFCCRNVVSNCKLVGIWRQQVVHSHLIHRQHWSGDAKKDQDQSYFSHHLRYFTAGA